MDIGLAIFLFFAASLGLLIYAYERPNKNKGKKLNKPFRTPGGPKKFSVYVKNDKGNIISPEIEKKY